MEAVCVSIVPVEVALRSSRKKKFCVPVEEETCAPEIVKIGLVVARKFVAPSEAKPGADTATFWTQSTSPPFPSAVHVTSTSPETAMPPTVVTVALDALNTDAPSTNVTVFEFPRLDTSLRNIYGKTMLNYSQVTVVGCTENS